MTCPKCGKELLIGSTLCPDCDVLEIPPKQKKRLSKRGKLIILSFLSAILLSVTLWVISYVSGFGADGVQNANALNMSCAEKIGNEFYFSDGDELFGIDGRFKNTELIDKGSDIYCLYNADGELYYVKNKVLCKFSPKKRVKTEILKLNAEKEISVVGSSKKAIYYSFDDGIYLFDKETSQIKPYCKGDAVIANNKLYVFSGGVAEKVDMSSGERVTICNIPQFDKPVFVKNNDIYVINYKEMKVYTINIKNGEREAVFNPADYENISDVSKMNYCNGFFFFTGEDGIYKVNARSGKSELLGDTGYVNSISIVDNKIFSRRYEGASYFSNMNGKILYKEEFDAE